MNKPQIDAYAISRLAQSIREDSERVAKISHNLNQYLQGTSNEWDSKRKQKFIQTLEESKMQISNAASLLGELANQVNSIPGKVIPEPDK
ncbi:hypothetical protein [Fictibacillus fluitans]|uniref:WXG100 family type VII secretion target n=1 Tax=Fictibacillus fluitans TaxID=3058422 RepID=A0ABT8I0B0_9BACL|nr:hypothetical protein [Fictibacillus sp. NE201]MDN4526477.1 hypothetical protein [Fictibacillus sp. NE201]